jgi:hypothetical protein
MDNRSLLRSQKRDNVDLNAFVEDDEAPNNQLEIVDEADHDGDIYVDEITTFPEETVDDRDEIDAERLSQELRFA